MSLLTKNIGAMMAVKVPEAYLNTVRMIIGGRGPNDPNIKRLPVQIQSMIKTALKDYGENNGIHPVNLAWKLYGPKSRPTIHVYDPNPIEVR